MTLIPYDLRFMKRKLQHYIYSKGMQKFITFIS